MKITKEQVLNLVNELNENFDDKYIILEKENSYEIAVNICAKSDTSIATIYNSDLIVFDSLYHRMDVKSFINNWAKNIKFQQKNVSDHENGLNKMLVDTAKSLSNQIKHAEKASFKQDFDVPRMSNSLLDIVKYLDEKNYREKMTK